MVILNTEESILFNNDFIKVLIEYKVSGSVEEE